MSRRVWRAGSTRSRCGLVLALALLFLCTGFVGFAASAMEIEARATKTDLLVGEPLVLVVSVKTTADVNLERDLTWPNAALQVLVDRGQGFVTYREKRWTSGWREPGKGPIEGGRATLEYVLSYDDNLKDWIFARPGVYRLVVEYRDEAEVGTVRSNVVTVTVRAPSGGEKTVHDAIRGIGPGALGVHQPTRLGDLKPLLAQFPTTVYLQEQRLNDLDARLERIMSGYDPDEILEAGTQADPPKRPDLRPDVVRDRLSGLFPDAEAAAAVEGPFQPGALLLLAGLYDATGDSERAKTTYERIVRDFPDREAARLAREEVGDAVAPTVQASAAPATLWPPNHQLIPVTVAITVTDDVDPSPRVKLESIVCEDGPRRACLSAEDIAEADYGTDDRAFELRASRLGAGTGRTYTITYSATDAAGNRATAATVVTVPHDQGKRGPGPGSP